MRSRLAGFLALLLITAGASSVRAQTPFYGFQGASFIKEMPMDLAAAVSDANPNIPNSAGYLVQFTNGGRYIYKKDQGTLVSILGPWEFWCSGTGLQSCDPHDIQKPYDTQIAYDPTTGHWIVAALSDDTNGLRGAYLYIAASQTADPGSTYYLHAASACSSGAVGDNPIMGISTGSTGRVVIELNCGPPPNGPDTSAEIFDIDINALEAGASIGANNTCSGANCTTLTSILDPNLKQNISVPIDLRPSTNLGQGSGIVLAHVVIGTYSYVGLDLWKVTPSASGVGQDQWEVFDPRNQSKPLAFYSQTAVMNLLEAPAPQPNCTQSSCEIQTSTLDPVGGAIQTNVNGYGIYAVSFSAVAPDGTDSYSLSFILNQHDGTSNWVRPLFPGAIVGFAQSALDPDGELVVNRTNFKSTGSHTAIDVINWNPISSASVVKTYALVSSSDQELLAGQCAQPGGSPCRWGDYTAEVYDPDPACLAVQAGAASECGLFWTTAEYTPDGANQDSWIAAVTDDIVSSEQLVTFAGYNNFNEFEGPTTCGVPATGSTTVSPPSGATNGDVFAAVVVAGNLAPYTSLQLPTGWSLLPLTNQGGTSLNAPLVCGANETAWVAVHTYSTSDTVPYSFTATTTTVPDTCRPGYCLPGEAAGFLTSYRGASQNAGSYTAYAYPNVNTYISAAPSQSVTGANELVNIFLGWGESDAPGSTDDNGCSEQFQYLNGTPAATGETPATISVPGIGSFFDADVWTGASATLGGYSVESACAYNYAPTTATLPAFQIVLPPAPSN